MGGINFFFINSFIKLKLIFNCWELKIKSQNWNADIFSVLRLFFLKQHTQKKPKEKTQQQQSIKKPQTNKKIWITVIQDKHFGHKSFLQLHIWYSPIILLLFNTKWEHAEMQNSANSVKLCYRTSQHRRKKEKLDDSYVHINLVEPCGTAFFFFFF